MQYSENCVPTFEVVCAVDWQMCCGTGAHRTGSWQAWYARPCGTSAARSQAPMHALERKKHMTCLSYCLNTLVSILMSALWCYPKTSHYIFEWIGHSSFLECHIWHGKFLSKTFLYSFRIFCLTLVIFCLTLVIICILIMFAHNIVRVSTCIWHYFLKYCLSVLSLL